MVSKRDDQYDRRVQPVDNAEREAPKDDAACAREIPGAVFRKRLNPPNDPLDFGD